MDMTGGFPITAFLEAEHDRPEFPAKARTVKARRANTLSVTEPPVVTDNGLCAESVPLNERALIGSRLVATGAGL